MLKLIPKTPEAIDGSAGPQSRPLLVLLLAAQALAAMDTSIANVAVPVIQRELNTAGSVLQAVVAGYVLAYAVLLVAGARMGDHLGYKVVFVAGISLFTAASLLCGFSQSGSVLVLARVGQGIGAALFVPQILSIIQRMYEGPERARILGFYSAILAVGVAAGQLIGGLIVAQDVLGMGWRAAFLMNLPIGLLLMTGATLIPSELRGLKRAPIDFAGLCVLTPSIALIVTPLIAIRETGWNALVGIALGVGLVGLWIFYRLERSTKIAGGFPLIDMDLLGLPAVRSSLLVIGLGFACYGGLLFSISLFVQNVLRFTPIGSGLVFCCYALGFGSANLVWPKLLPRSLIPLCAFCALFVLALAQGAVAVWSQYLGWHLPLYLFLLLLSGTSHGLAFGPVVSFASGKIPSASAGLLSGLVTTTVQTAIVLGVATLGSIYLWRSTDASSTEAIALTSLGCALASLVALIPAGLILRDAKLENN